ncbi:hypothetical protein SDRG_05935 [Saprolegnia diclina VS20]|uniref:Uncharacterized protein n=1 Tax=Saprolegnia diclina (strain VS20) TaxID=1156394 RepID=T0QP48_SAPDV|nr:hypothetical protein SDRG_05935 [Saprolegnia diclina VS20]EQC36481.1 hypothetical protein SDRG_05935 [Saprolegnia diclina VS20]|eukprot:XP_008609902.1 hypothetical protein SDRG_05935 [Saprolegnia diclina VS20]
MKPRRKTLLGLAYVALSMACSVYYTRLLSPHMVNDLYWPSFGLHGAHTYLLDLYRVHLWTASNGSIDAFDASNALLKDYDKPSTMLDVQPSYPRAILLSEQTSVRTAVEAIRSLSVELTFSLFTQYCWVDVQKRWELGHTAARQARCAAQYANNAAVILEPHLRIVEWAHFLERFETAFMFSVGNAVVASPGGVDWLASVQDAFVSVEDEVGFWLSHGLTHFTLQWGNTLTIGIHETLSVVDAFGGAQQLSIASMTHMGRGALWTTGILYWYLFDDLWISAMTNGSLVRSASNFMANNSLGPSVSMEDMAGVYPFTPASIIVHDALGPFVSIDSFYVAPPGSMQAFTAAFLLGTALVADASLQAT